MNSHISYIQGYKSMYFFLSEYANVPVHEDICSLLGDLLFIDHGDEISTSDPASWDVWIECIHNTFPELRGTKKGQLTYLQSFKIMICFLEEYCRSTSSEEIASLLDELFKKNQIIWNRWIFNIQKAFSANSSAG